MTKIFTLTLNGQHFTSVTRDATTRNRQSRDTCEVEADAEIRQAQGSLSPEVRVR